MGFGQRKVSIIKRLRPVTSKLSRLPLPRSWETYGVSCRSWNGDNGSHSCEVVSRYGTSPLTGTIFISSRTTWTISLFARYGAPAPLFCRPKKDKNDFTGSWNYGFFCNVPWVDPPITCDDYPGQKAGRFENDEPYPNRNGRTDVEGCCWWGRGVIQTTGVW